VKRAVIVARDNSYGLSVDSAVLGGALRRLGWEVAAGVPGGRGLIERLLRRRTADVVFHMERVFPAWASAAPVNVLVPNQERFPRRHLGRLRHVALVAAKSRHAQRIFAELGCRTALLGFSSPDRLLDGIEKDWNGFFHLAGGSTLKGTEDILALWTAHPEWPQLVLVQKAANAPAGVPANVRLISGYLDDAELRQLQNRCGVHLCPSRAEGWGHYVVEALSVGAVTVTTDAPPMNELVTESCGVLVPVEREEARHLGTSYFVDRNALETAIERLTLMSASEKAGLGMQARARYDEVVAAFHDNCAALVDELGNLGQKP
jgi:hypothetical protein